MQLLAKLAPWVSAFSWEQIPRSLFPLSDSSSQRFPEKGMLWGTNLLGIPICKQWLWMYLNSYFLASFPYVITLADPFFCFVFNTTHHCIWAYDCILPYKGKMAESSSLGYLLGWKRTAVWLVLGHRRWAWLTILFLAYSFILQASFLLWWCHSLTLASPSSGSQRTGLFSGMCPASVKILENWRWYCSSLVLTQTLSDHTSYVWPMYNQNGRLSVKS